MPPAPVRIEVLEVVLDQSTDAMNLSFDVANATTLLVHLLDNAIDFSHSDAEVTLKASELNGEIHIDVIDHGPGFADYVRDRIGERFLSTPRPEGVVGGRAKGSGLGLAIARQVAELHGGKLDVASFAKPTVVRMLLPLSQ